MSTFNKKRHHKSTGYHRACATVSKVRFVHSSVWKEVQRTKRTRLILLGPVLRKKVHSLVYFFFFKIFLHAFLSYRHKSNADLLLILSKNLFDSIFSINIQQVFGYFTFSPSLYCPFPNVLYIGERTRGVLFSFVFFTKRELHAGEWHGNTKSGQKVERCPPALNKHKQETRVRHGFSSRRGRPPQTTCLGRECDSSGRWQKGGGRQGPGLLYWFDEGAAPQTDPSRLQDFLLPGSPRPLPELGRRQQSGPCSRRRRRRRSVMSLTRDPPVARWTRWCHRPSPASRWEAASRALWAPLVTSSRGPGRQVCICGKGGKKQW